MSFTFNGVAQIVVYFLLLLLITKPLGLYLYAVFEGQRTWLTPVLRPVERALYAISGVDATREQDWKVYTVAMLLFEVISTVPLYIFERVQDHLPLNPAGMGSVDPLLAWNTAISFLTNTNWQNYSGETTMSHLVQMLGLTVHNFVSAATGLAMAFALVRGFARAESATVGNFWTDLTRGTLYLLLPISILIALALVALGVPQTLAGSVEATTLEGAKQMISIGPVASQEAIKELGTNGGGFFNAN
ncbi:MAG: potassium-transporting ATPase subunit KdpA, partial [Chloroflexota bacterium]|nr:potassium-transporting ATPase subunit KdpA [Chloroflexota bacterium]